jgi:DNA-binding GntR family transcriptional regulator
MQILRPVSLREQAVRSLRGSILGGELEAGQVYSTQSLSERLGVSATPVREALLDLANAGLVQPIRNRGFRIVTVDEADLDEICAVREMLEAPAMRLVVELASDEELASVETMLADLEAAARERDVPRFLLIDREFHLTLLSFSRNRRLVREVEQLRDQTRLVGISGLAASGKLDQTAAEHRPILEALQRRDADAAEELMHSHIHHTRGIWAGREES